MGKMSSQRYKILYKEGEAEISEKKSRFIAHIAPAQTEEEAQAFIEKIKKQYWDARHNCYAYIIGEDGRYVGDDTILITNH